MRCVQRLLNSIAQGSSVALSAGYLYDLRRPTRQRSEVSGSSASDSLPQTPSLSCRRGMGQLTGVFDVIDDTVAVERNPAARGGL